MKRFLTIILTVVLAAGCGGGAQQVQPQEPEQQGVAFAALSVINMREAPDFAAELGTQALMGTPLKVYDNDGYWYRVETPDGYRAWVVGMAIAPCTQEDIDVWKTSRRIIVDTYFTLFRSAPSPEADVVCDGVWGDIALFKGVCGEFTEVQLPTGAQAFVASADVKDFDQWVESRTAVVEFDGQRPDSCYTDVEAAQQQIISTAKKFLGFPYLWAGTSVKGVDCSGFAKTVYFLNGYLMLRNASQQARGGDDVDISHGLGNLQPADLIFFGRKATDDKPEKVTHVGIYIGGGKFIHAAQVVRINSLIEGEPDYYDGSGRLLRGRRIINNQDCDKQVWSIKNSDVYR